MVSGHVPGVQDPEQETNNADQTHSEDQAPAHEAHHLNTRVIISSIHLSFDKIVLTHSHPSSSLLLSITITKNNVKM